MNPGDKVTIYVDPLTECEPEGQVTLVEFLNNLGQHDRRVLQQWKVRFPGEPEACYTRMILTPAQDTPTTGDIDAQLEELLEAVKDARGPGLTAARIATSAGDDQLLGIIDRMAELVTALDKHMTTAGAALPRRWRR